MLNIETFNISQKIKENFAGNNELQGSTYTVFW